MEASKLYAIAVRLSHDKKPRLDVVGDSVQRFLKVFVCMLPIFIFGSGASSAQATPVSNDYCQAISDVMAAVQNIMDEQVIAFDDQGGSGRAIDARVLLGRYQIIGLVLEEMYGFSEICIHQE